MKVPDDFFDISSSVDAIKQDSNGRALIGKSAFKAKLRHDKRDAEFAELVKSVGGMPSKNTYLAFKSNGLSDTGSIFRYIIDQHQCDQLYLSTWIISRDNIDALIKSIDEKRLANITFIVSTRLQQLKKSNYAHLVESFAEYSDSIRFRVCNSHAKVFSISDFHGNYWTVSGSGNWTMNPRIENYLIINDINLFNHHKEWMEELL